MVGGSWWVSEGVARHALRPGWRRAGRVSVQSWSLPAGQFAAMRRLDSTIFMPTGSAPGMGCIVMLISIVIVVGE
jgi:hypothetical protein